MEHWVQKRQRARELLQQRMADQCPGGQRPNTARFAADRRELVKVLEDWPAPKPSPHYRLRVFGVLHEAATRPVTGAPLLPLLKQRHVQSGGGKMLGAGEDPLVTFDE